MKETRGFTLLELLMVVIIIAILASIALPQYFRVTERSRTGQVIQLLASIRGSQMRFKAQSANNAYDGTNAALDLAPLPGLPGGWGAIAAPPGVANAVGENISVKRTAGTNNGKLLVLDLDTGNVCSDNATAATDWNVAPPGC